VTGARPAVVFAATEPWEAFTWLAAALRKRGFDSNCLTAPPRTRMQKISSLAYRVAYNRTEQALRWPGDTAPVNVDTARSVWAPNVVDLQTTDRVGAALAMSPRWASARHLHRVPDPDKTMRLFDKLSQTQDATDAGVIVPRTWTSPDAVRGNRVVIKQRLGSGGDAVVIVDVTEINEWTSRWAGQGGGLLFQEVIEGDVLNVSGFAKDGQIQEVIAYLSLPSPTDPNGPSVRIQTVSRPDLIADTGRYLDYMQFTGAFCLDFIAADSGNYLIDVNPRFFGSWAAVQRAGLPILEAYLKHLRDRPFNEPPASLPSQTLWTAPAASGNLRETARESLRTLAGIYPIIGNRGVVAAAPSLARALRSAS
jgi:hypothetical protein